MFKKAFRACIQAVLSLVRILRSIWGALSIIAIVISLLLFAALALIAEAGERLFSLIGSALTALVKRLGDRLTKEKTT